MKRALTLILTLALVTACIVGCGTKNEPTSDATPGTDQPDGQTSTLNWPTGNITMIVPWGAGAGNDLCARNLVPYLEEELGVSITVVNEPGANGWIGWNDLLSQDADGNTISIINLPTVFSGYMDPQQNRSENADSFMFVANSVSDWDTIVVRADDDRFTGVQSFVDYAKDHELLSGDPGVGTNMNLVAATMRSEFDIQLTDVHMSGAWSEIYPALLGGHIDVSWVSLGNALQAYQDGELKILAVFAPERCDLAPEIPTFNEQMEGHDITSSSDRGFALKAGTDQAIYERWCEAMEKCINNPEYVQSMADLGVGVNCMVGDDFTNYVKEQEAKFESGAAKILGWK